MDWFDDKRIKQYAYSLLVIALTMFILMGVFSFLSTKHFQEENFEEVSLHMTEFLEEAIHKEINRYISYGLMLADSEEVDNFLSMPSNYNYQFRLENLIDYTRYEYEKYESIAINSYDNPEESIRHCFLTGMEVVEVEKSYFRNHHYFIGNFKLYQNKLLLQITLPVIVDEEIIGNICLQIDMQDFLDQYVETITYRETGYIYLISQNHDILISPSRIIDHASLIAEFDVARTLGNTRSEVNGKEYYIKPLVLSLEQNENYYLVFTQSTDEVHSSTKYFIFNAVIMIFVFSFVFMILTKITGKRFIRLAKEDTRVAVKETLDSEVKRQTQALRKIAEMDSLTKLYNHGSFFRLLRENIEEAKKNEIPICLMMLDLDFFKDVNDNYGHPVGDEVLVSLAELLEDNIREEDMAGRYGGEEFAIMLKHIHLDKGYAIAERIRKQVLAKTFTDHKIKLTISIGIAELDQEDVSEFVKKADKKLYASKSYGRNKTTF